MLMRLATLPLCQTSANRLKLCVVKLKVRLPQQKINHLNPNQSINVKFVGRRYTTRPGAPTVVSGKHDHKVHSCRFLNVPVSVMSWRSEGRVFQATGPQYEKPRSQNLVLVLGRT